MNNRWFFVIIQMLVISVNLYAAGFVVDPSAIKAISVPLAKNYEIFNSSGTDKYFLSIKNTKSAPSRYRIEIMSCKAYGIKPRAGYGDIPVFDKKSSSHHKNEWIKIESPDISVPPLEVGYVKGVYVKIPKKKEYYGKRYQAIVKVI